jgi:hypothetical protein
MRSVVDVIIQLLKIIPEDEIKFINDLTKYKKSLWNKAPEIRESECWYDLTIILNNNISDPNDTEWKKEIFSIFNNSK